MDEFSALLRKLGAVLPRWVNKGLVGSFVVGVCLKTVVNHVAYVQLLVTQQINYNTVSEYEWIILGVVITMPICAVWHFGRRFVRGPSPLENAEEYITIVKYAADHSGLSDVQKRARWNEAMTKLLKEFSVGSKPPEPAAIIRQMQAPS